MAKLAYVDPDQAKKDRFRIIHWAPHDALPVKVMKPDGVDEGVGEAGIAGELGRVVQFERYGFVRINRLGDPIVAYYAHR
jgi:glutamyl-tRNA synthetase